MTKGEETLPLTGASNTVGHRDQRIMLGITAAVALLTAVFCLPPIVPAWHKNEFQHTEIQQRAWTWFGVNSLWFSLPLLWTVCHPDNGPAAAAGCLLCAIFWAYLDVALITQFARGILEWTVVLDFFIHAVLCVFCARAAWGGVASPVHASRSDGSNTSRRMIRKWILVVASIQLFMAFVACWPLGELAVTPPRAEREAAPWEWNSAVLFTLMLAVLWAAFLTRGGYVDETKRAMCVFCAIVFAGGFALSSFDWPYLGLIGHNVITSTVLAVDACVFLVAAVI
ncbi:unnamed protein product [Sphacelaria rigidula]